MKLKFYIDEGAREGDGYRDASYRELQKKSNFTKKSLNLFVRFEKPWI